MILTQQVHEARKKIPVLQPNKFYDLFAFEADFDDIKCSNMPDARTLYLGNDRMPEYSHLKKGNHYFVFFLNGREEEVQLFSCKDYKIEGRKVHPKEVVMADILYPTSSERKDNLRRNLVSRLQEAEAQEAQA